jgi:hypothetical protein
MELGAVFPQTEIGDDPAAVREFTQAQRAIVGDRDAALRRDDRRQSHVASCGVQLDFGGNWSLAALTPGTMSWQS